jgi:tetratricopeptide (TPR) repeat protein
LRGPDLKQSTGEMNENFKCDACNVSGLFLSVGCGNSGVEKAKEFMAAGMYPQAKELLDKRIQENPEDAEAHYTLGVCFLNTGDLHKADERFASAVRLKADYGFQIGGDSMKMGKDASIQGDTHKMKVFFEKAIQFQPGLKK